MGRLGGYSRTFCECWAQILSMRRVGCWWAFGQNSDELCPLVDGTGGESFPRVQWRRWHGVTSYVDKTSSPPTPPYNTAASEPQLALTQRNPSSPKEGIARSEWK